MNEKSVFKKAFTLFCFFILSTYLFPQIRKAHAVIINRQVPQTWVVNTLGGSIPSSTCPSDLLPNHISICGIVRSVDAGGYQYGSPQVQAPIKGATVALYLGASHASNIPSNFSWVKADPNQTGEIAGRIDGLYMYDITNSEGRFIISAPRSVGTGGMAFLAFFCGDYLKDLYMIDTSRDIQSFPVSLACESEVTPANHPDLALDTTTGTVIPAPPSVTYANRTLYTSCENDAEYGSPGLIEDSQRTVTVPLYKAQLDNTRVGAQVWQQWRATCVGQSNNDIIDDSYPGDGRYPPGCTTTTGPTAICDGRLYGVRKCCSPNTCSGEGDNALTYCEAGDWSHWYTYHFENISQTDVINFDHPNSYGKEVPEETNVLSGRDLEGFTVSSIMYSNQALSSLNCGVSGCYDTSPPARGDSQNLTVSAEIVNICNTAPFPPLRCKGPGVELGIPGEYENSYNMQRDTVVFDDGTTLGDITQPQYSSEGQVIQDIWRLPAVVEILEILRRYDIQFVDPSSTSRQGLIDALNSLFSNMGDENTRNQIEETFQHLQQGFTDLSQAYTAYQQLRTEYDFSNVVRSTIEFYMRLYLCLKLSVNGIDELQVFITEIQDLMDMVSPNSTSGFRLQFVVNGLESARSELNAARDDFYAQLTAPRQRLDDFIACIDTSGNLSGIQRFFVDVYLRVTVGIEVISEFLQSLGIDILPDPTTLFPICSEQFEQIVQSVLNIPAALNRLILATQNIYNLVFQMIEDIIRLYILIPSAILQLNSLQAPTVASNYFPYSMLLNDQINGKLIGTFSNRPINDSYANDSGFTLCLNNSDAENSRRVPAAQGTASAPFKACYGGVFLSQDAYSLQKALYTTTKNTDLAILHKAATADPNYDYVHNRPQNDINDPVVSGFLPKNEQVGLEASPLENSLPSSITDIPKVGKGYWRIGIVDTLCTHGTDDYFVNENIQNTDTVDYPFTAINASE